MIRGRKQLAGQTTPIRSNQDSVVKSLKKYCKIIVTKDDSALGTFSPKGKKFFTQVLTVPV